MNFTVNRWVSWVLIPLLVALPLAFFMCYGALDHNPQEEFCSYVARDVSANYSVQGENCNIKWGAIGLLFAVWIFAQLAVLTVVRLMLSAFRDDKRGLS